MISDLPFNILLVEDEPDQVTLTIPKLEKLDLSKLDGCTATRVHVVPAINQDEADEQIFGTNAPCYDLILLDLIYPGRGEVEPNKKKFQGMEWLPDLSCAAPDATIVILTAHPYDNELENAVQAVIEGWAHEFIPKNTQWEDIERRIRIAYKRARQIQRARKAIRATWELVRTESLRTHIEDILNIVSRYQTWFYNVAADLRGGEAAAVRRAPSLIEGHYNSLLSDLLSETRRLDVYPERKAEPIELGQWLRQIVSNYEDFFAEIGARIIVESTTTPVEIATFTSDLRIVIHEILCNALWALDISTTAKGRRLVRINTRWLRNRTAGVTIINNGVPLPEVAEETLFAPGFSSHAPAAVNYRHHGMGLYVVKRLMPILGGSISIKNQVAPDSGVMVSMELSDRGSVSKPTAN